MPIVKSTDCWKHIAWGGLPVRKTRHPQDRLYFQSRSRLTPGGQTFCLPGGRPASVDDRFGCLEMRAKLRTTGTDTIILTLIRQRHFSCGMSAPGRAIPEFLAKQGARLDLSRLAGCRHGFQGVAWPRDGLSVSRAIAPPSSGQPIPMASASRLAIPLICSRLIGTDTIIRSAGTN